MIIWYTPYMMYIQYISSHVDWFLSLQKPEASWVLLRRSSNWTTLLMCRGSLKPGRNQGWFHHAELFSKVWSKMLNYSQSLHFSLHFFLILFETMALQVYRSYYECFLMDTEETASGSLIFEEVWQDAVQKSLSGRRFWKKWEKQQSDL